MWFCSLLKMQNELGSIHHNVQFSVPFCSIHLKILIYFHISEYIWRNPNLTFTLTIPNEQF